MILEQIKGPEELKQLSSRELAILAEEIRTFLIEKISRTGGHLASNLGVVDGKGRKNSGCTGAEAGGGHIQDYKGAGPWRHW